MSSAKKVTPHAEIPGCGAKPAKDDAKAPKTPEMDAKAPTKAETRTVTAEAPPPEKSRLSRAVRFVVGGVVTYATGT